jgi:hypothetical protein
MTNQYNVINAVKSGDFNNLDYVSRTYFANSDTDPLVMLAILRSNNTDAVYVTIHAVNVSSDHDIEIYEKRKVSPREINYFDHEHQGIIMLLTPTQQPTLVNEHTEEDLQQT